MLLLRLGCLVMIDLNQLVSSDLNTRAGGAGTAAAADGAERTLREEAVGFVALRLRLLERCWGTAAGA